MIRSNLKSIFSLFAITLVIGCSSSQPVTQEYYVLSNSRDSNITMISGQPIMSIRRVKIPRYLEQEGLATQLANNKIQISFTDLWAQKLSQSIPPLLAREIETKLQKPIEIHPLPAGHKVSTILEVDISKLLGNSEQLTLEAKYRLIKANSLITNNFNTLVRLDNKQASTLVHAHEIALQRLAMDIADKL